MEEKRKVVLVVDDELDLIELVADELEHENCQVLRASCGDEALALLQENEVDAILSDVRMPNGNGIALLEQVKKGQAMKDVPFILMTGYNDISKKDALKKGALDIVNKPFDLERLVAFVKRQSTDPA